MATPAEILAAGGLTNAGLIVQAATATGIPLAILAAMVQKESGGQNIYGRDGKDTASPGVYANDYPLQVTKENFTEFRAAVLAGQKSNGVGPSQITYPGYWKQYPDYPFWDVLANLKFGATLLMDLLDGDTSDASISSAGAHYNGGTSPNEKAVAYGADLLTKTNAWRASLVNTAEEATPVSYNFIAQYDSPNHGGFGTQIALPARRAVLHWWGSPSGQNPQGIIDWLCNPASQVSAHAVVWKGSVACLVNYDEPSWANGNATANTTAITLECDPNDIDGTIPTIVDYLADLVRQRNLVEDFELTGHRDWYNTACPGDYYSRLAEIRQAVRDDLAGITTTPSEEEDIMSDPQVIELLTQISRATLGSADALTRGQSGIKWAGDAYRHLAIVSDALTSGYPANPDAGIEERPEGDIHRYLRELAERTPVEPERAEPEPAEPDASKEAIKTAVTAIRAAADAIEAQL